MGNPIDNNNSLRHHLEFVSLGVVPLYEICEPIGFDGAEFVKTQEAGRHARSTEYFAINKLKFVADVYGTQRLTKQQTDPQGNSSYFLDMGLKFILESIKQYGFNAKVNYYNSVNGVFSKPFQLFFGEKNLTDFKTYIECMLVQNNKTSEILKKIDDKFNAFATENYKGDIITPIETFKVLRNYTPIFVESKWELDKNPTIVINNSNSNITRFVHFNALKLITGKARESYVPFKSSTTTNLYQTKDFKYFKSKFNSRNVKIKIDFNFIYEYGHYSGDDGTARSQLYFQIKKGYTFDSSTTIFSDFRTIDGFSQILNINEEFNHNIDYLNVGECLWIYFTSESFLADVKITVNKLNQSLFLEQSSLASVFPVVRYANLIKQSIKSINDIFIKSKYLEPFGEFYEQVCYTKSMVSNRVDKLFATPKQCLESVFEYNCDYEISNDHIDILRDHDYYEDTEIGSFPIISSESYSADYNEECMINNMKIEWKNFANDRDIENSTQSIHTKSEWNIINPEAKNKFEKSFDFIRDSVYIQDLIDRQILDPTKSTEENENIIIESIVEMPIGTYFEETFNLLLQYKNQIASGNGYTLIILNKNKEDTEGEGTFLDFVSIGITIGQIVYINHSSIPNLLLGYTVVSVTSSQLELFTDSLSQSTEQQFVNNENNIIKIRFFYIGIQYKIKNDEGFDVVNGVSRRFTNLDFTPKRILRYFERQLASFVKYSEGLEIKNVFFKNNGNVETKLTSELEVLVENTPIVKSKLPLPYINPVIHNLEIVCDFTETEEMLKKYKITKGYIRCFDSYGKVIKGFLKDFKYNRLTQLATIQLKEKYKTDKIFLTVNNSQKLELDGVEVKEWKFENDYFTAYDKKMRPLCESTLFNLVILNGISFLTKSELIINLQSL
jgi:hypothetical protein